MNNFPRIILYHKCVCGILLRKLKKYSKYTMKTCQENLWHTYMMCYFYLVIGWGMQGWLKGQSHILKTAIMVPRKRLSRAIAATFWPCGRWAPVARGARMLKKVWQTDRQTQDKVFKWSIAKVVKHKPYVVLPLSFWSVHQIQSCVQYFDIFKMAAILRSQQTFLSISSTRALLSTR